VCQGKLADLNRQILLRTPILHCKNGNLGSTASATTQADLKGEHFKQHIVVLADPLIGVARLCQKSQIDDFVPIFSLYVGFVGNPASDARTW
jgi:hypothetical protein